MSFQDVIKFGFSSREYVILHEKSQVNEDDDDGGNSDTNVNQDSDKE